MSHIKSLHWRASCALNLVLGGRSDEPLCSRVFGKPPSRFRRAYLMAMDKLFNESSHCLRVHAQYLLYKLNQRYPSP